MNKKTMIMEDYLLGRAISMRDKIHDRNRNSRLWLQDDTDKNDDRNKLFELLSELISHIDRILISGINHSRIEYLNIQRNNILDEMSKL